MESRDRSAVRSSSSAAPFGDVLDARLTRRNLLSGAAASAAIMPGFVGSLFGNHAYAAGTMSTLNFTELKRVFDKTHHVSPGFTAQIVMRWGDAVLADAPAFDAAAPSAMAQSRQFGYNNDFTAFLPLPLGSNSSERGLLFANHEYPDPHVMFPGFVVKWGDAGKLMSKEQVDLALESKGHSVVEIEKVENTWRPVKGSIFNRRISTLTEFTVTGPAAGHALMKTVEDPTGTKVSGTAANCGGGMTPWGTVLSCEEFAYAFFGGDPAETSQAKHIKRIGMEGFDYCGAARFYDRFNIEKEPNELNRFQWVVEIDPYEPDSVPMKRTALGRFGHEGATIAKNPDGRITVYMGDDGSFEYIYRFVSKHPMNASDRKWNLGLLDEGTLSVAKFAEDGTLTWVDLVHGENGLAADKGFADQGEVLIKARQAADLVGATPMDRPEDFETNPVTGRVYVVLSKNKKRKADALNAANMRPENKWGHIVELIPPGEGAADHAAAIYKWDILILCGDPSKPETGAKFHPETTADDWFVTPDNICFDPKGRMWVATDGQNDFELADGIFGIDTAGPARGLPKALFAAPIGAEVTGPSFTPDGKTLFVSVQHPGGNSETIEKLTTQWPDFAENSLPRPAVVAIMREDGGEIGG